MALPPFNSISRTASLPVASVFGFGAALRVAVDHDRIGDDLQPGRASDGENSGCRIAIRIGGRDGEDDQSGVFTSMLG